MGFVHGHNLTEPYFEAAKCMAYFEKHNLLEISRHLLLQLGMNRTIDVKGFIKDNIKKIADEVNTKHSILMAPSVFDVDAFSKYMRKHFNIPSIIYTKERETCDGYKILKKFKKLLKHLDLEHKNIIFVNFPSNRVECLHFRKEHINPNCVIEIKPSFQIPFKTEKMLEDEQSSYIEKLKQVKSFYGNLSRVIIYGAANESAACPNASKGSYNQTIEEIGLKIVQMLRNTEISKDQLEAGKFLPRVVILGRRGSGRRTQARKLANLFKLVFVDVQHLILETMKQDSSVAEFLRNAAQSHEYSDLAVSSIVQKRLLEPDCLKVGYVIVGFPNDVDGLKYMDRFLVPPNKIIFLHCRERVALRRLQKFWQRDPLIKAIYSPKDNCSENSNLNHIEKHKSIDKSLLKYLPKDISFLRQPKSQDELRDQLENLVKQEFSMFNLAKKPLLKYLSGKRETIHIDGNHTRKTVSTAICARVEQQQNSFGSIK